jgi:hypothetical protein
VAFLRFHGLDCRFCLEERPHPGDVAKLPPDPPGSIWAIVMEDLPVT